MKSIRLPWFQRSVFGLLLLASFALRAYQLDGQDIWWDEARNIDVASRPFAQIAVAPELDIHPPIYFYLLHGWERLAHTEALRLPGDGAFLYRFLSLWFSVLFVALMAALGRRIGGGWAGLGAAAGAAFLPFLLGEAQEARMYTMLLVWLAAAGLAVLRAEDSDRRSAVSGEQSALGVLYGLLFALFSALALLTHYAAVFALLALWGWAGLQALFGGRAGLGRRLRAVLLAGLTTALLCLPGLPVALRQIPGYRNPNLVVPSIGVYLADLARVYALGEHIDLAAARPWAWGLAALLVVGWMLAAGKRIRACLQGTLSAHQRITHHTSRIRQCIMRSALFALLWAVLPLAIYYLVIADRSTFATRYIAGALPGWLLLGGLAVRGWARLHRVAAGLAVLALIAVFVPGLAGDLTDSRFFREDTRGLVSWLKENTIPSQDLILVDQRYPFGFYYARWNNAPGGFPPAEPENIAPAQYLFVDINTLDARLTALAAGRQRIFWVRWFESDTDPRGAAPFLLEKFGTLEGERVFRGYVVTWYAVSPAAQFELAPGLAGSPADFGGQVRLAGYAIGGRGRNATSALAETRAPSAPADTAVWATVQWARLPGAVDPGRALARGLKATVVLEDANGFVVGRDDRAILNDRHLTPSQWAEADRPLGVYLVRPEPGTPPGTYTLRLGVYDPVTLASLPATGDRAQGSFVSLGQIELTQATRAASIEGLPLDAQLELVWAGLRLLGRGPLPAQVSPGDRLTFELFWRAEQAGLPDLAAQFELAPDDSGVVSLAPQQTSLGSGYLTSRWVAGEIVRDRQAWRLDPATPPGAYRLQLRLVDRQAATLSPAVEIGALTVAGRAHSFELPAHMAHRSDARFGDFARLLGFDLAAPTASALTLTLYWRAEATPTVSYSVSAQLLDAGDVLVAQRDQQPGAGAFPTLGWVVDEVLTDSYRIDLPADLTPGRYALIVKLYDPATGSVVPAADASGTPMGDFLYLTEMQIP